MTPHELLLLAILLFTLITLTAIISVLNASRRGQRDLAEIDRVIRLFATRWQIPLPPGNGETDQGPAGQCIHWENYPIKHEAPDPREVEKVEG